MSRVKELLERIYRERDLFGGMEHRISQAAAEDAKDFADYEAAVEALERVTGELECIEGIEHLPHAVRLIDDARAALARLRDEVPA